MTTYGLKTGHSADLILSGKVSHSLATAENDVLVGAPTPFGLWVKKTLAEFKTILGLGTAAYTASTAYDAAGTAAGKIAASISDGDTTHAPDGNSIFDALALKAPLISPFFTTPALGTPASGNLANCTGYPSAGLTWSIVTSATNAVKSNGYFCDTQTTAAFTLTLPTTPTLGDEIYFADLRGYFATNNLTIVRNSEKIMGLAEDMIVSVNNIFGRLVYSGATYGWRLV